MFVTQFVPHSRVYTNSGSRIHILHKPVIDENGHMELVESGKENIYDFIQSFKDSCDISLIVKRFTNGEIDILSRRQGMFFDATEMPKNLAETLNYVRNAEEQFKSLPVEVRAKFGHSFSEWVASAGTPDFFEKMGMTNSVDVVKEEGASFES